jgi:protein-arginine kinase activator protein McsA
MDQPRTDQTCSFCNENQPIAKFYIGNGEDTGIELHACDTCALKVSAVIRWNDTVERIKAGEQP